jgi:hypothetical protein
MPPDPERPRHSRPQLTRLELAGHDLAQAREADLAAMDPATLILLVERLRGTLDDVVRLVDELAQPFDQG